VPAKKFEYRPYVLGLLAVTIVFLLSWLFPQWILVHNLLMILLLPTIVSGILWGLSVSFFTSVVALGLYTFFFIPPVRSFAITDLRYLSNIVLFVLIVMGVSWIGRMIRWRADSARHREKFVYALYNFSRELIGAENFADILKRATRSIVEAFESDIMILLPDKSGQLEITTKNKEELVLNEMEKAVAMWVYKNGRHAGKGTNTLSSAKWYYVPLKTRDTILGVICLMKLDIDKTFSPEQRRLLESFVGVVALALLKVNK
jgi:two-component system sensor histidine kinase KdpD